MNFNSFVQIGLTLFTVLGYFLISFKLPQYGLLVTLLAQFFWFYASYRAWKDANQISIFITTIFITISVIIGIVNYWFL
jgi:hypothetical protein